MFLKLRLHADSGITNNELVASISGRRRFQLFYPDADGASNFVKLNSITQNIQQHLCQSQFIRNNILISYVHCINEKIQLPGSNIGLHNGTDIMEQIWQMQRILVDFYFTALDPAPAFFLFPFFLIRGYFFVIGISIFL